MWLRPHTGRPQSGFRRVQVFQKSGGASQPFSPSPHAARAAAAGALHWRGCGFSTLIPPLTLIVRHGLCHAFVFHLLPSSWATFALAVPVLISSSAWGGLEGGSRLEIGGRGAASVSVDRAVQAAPQRPPAARCLPHDRFDRKHTRSLRSCPPFPAAPSAACRPNRHPRGRSTQFFWGSVLRASSIRAPSAQAALNAAAVQSPDPPSPHSAPARVCLEPASGRERLRAQLRAPPTACRPHVDRWWPPLRQIKLGLPRELENLHGPWPAFQMIFFFPTPHSTGL
jgi:hypothetical protein